MKTVAIAPGERLDVAIRRCIAVALNAGDEAATGIFNGTPILAAPSDDFDTVEKRYWVERKRIQDRKGK